MTLYIVFRFQCRLVEFLFFFCWGGKLFCRGFRSASCSAQQHQSPPIIARIALGDIYKDFSDTLETGAGE